MRLSSRLLSVSTALGLLFGAAAGAAFGADIDKAIAAYNAKKYSEAIPTLNALVSKNPNNEKARYYLALSYQAINQIQPAKKEYFWLYQQGKDSRLKYNAWMALSSLERWGAHRAYQGQGNNFSSSSGSA